MTKPVRVRKYIILSLIVSILYGLSPLLAQDGKALFNANCASCHKVDKDLTGPALAGVEDRWPNKQLLVSWIKNWSTAVATGDPYPVKMKDWSPAAMNTFPNLSDAEVDAILAYVKDYKPAGAVAGATASAPAKTEGNNTWLFALISFILALVAIILMQVNSNLRKLNDEKEGRYVGADIPVWKNKTWLALAAIFFFILTGVFVSNGAIKLGRSKDYQPLQPIFYSHKVHAGTNQINCQYCHSAVAKGKHATIPGVNVCMNCHMAISEYTGETLYDEAGNEVNGTLEIQKLYEYAGFTKGTSWNPAKAKPVEWIKIHNLPDHVYFNHSQHVVAGKVACQTCHGEIQKMDEVKQFSDLSMGWCVNCHRQTKVQFNDNGFYSIYEKFHDDMKNGKLDSVTVEKVGGTECQKCHY